MNLVAYVFIFCFTVVVVESRSSRTSSSSLDNESNQRPNIWAEKAVEYVRNLTCDHIFYNVLHQCQQMKQTPTDQFRIYAVEASKQTKLLTVLADGPLNRMSGNDGVLVLDPFPDASFGHLVLVFFVEHMKPILAVHDRAKCEISGGLFIGMRKLVYCLKADCIQCVRYCHCKGIYQSSIVFRKSQRLFTFGVAGRVSKSKIISSLVSKTSSYESTMRN